MDHKDKKPEPAVRDDSTTLLKILQEKDKIIVSLKDSAGERDRLNESQIRLLSEDNDKKTREIDALKEKLGSIQSQYIESASKLGAYQERVEQSTRKFDELKGVLKEYKSNISHTLDHITDMVANELTSREKQAAAMAERLHANHKMLEERLEILNKQHQSTVAQFAGRQNEAKSMIREALQYLQEALNRLDLGSADMSISEVQLDRGVMDEFNSILRESEQAFAELNSRIRETGNVIHKIENLNNQLTDTPKLDRHFTEIDASIKGVAPPSAPVQGGLAEGSIEDLDALLEAAAREDRTGQPGAGSTKGGGAAQGGGGAAGTSGSGTGPDAVGKGGGASGGPGSAGGPTAALGGPQGVPDGSGTPPVPGATLVPGGMPGYGTASGSGGMAGAFAAAPRADAAGQPGWSGGGGQSTAGGFGTGGDGTGAPGAVGAAAGGGGYPGTGPGGSGSGGTGYPGAGGGGFGGTGGGYPGFWGGMPLPPQGYPGYGAFPGGGGGGTAAAGGRGLPAGAAPGSAPLPGMAGTAVLEPGQQETTLKPDDDLIMRDSPNLAPYNWDMLPATSPLLRFRRLLNNAKRAEHLENYTKALDIYEVIKQQRTIQDDSLSLNILQDQTEAINRLARAQVSNNKKRDSVERYYRRERTDDKRHPAAPD